MNDRVENMIVSGLDQDWAEAVSHYEELSPLERGDVVDFIAQWDGTKTGLKKASPFVLGWISFLASVAVLETAYRWAKQQDVE